MRCLGCFIRYADIIRAGLRALLWLAVANAAMADEAAPLADSPMRARNVQQPPALSEEIKRLLDGFLKIQRSDTLVFDQRGIEETLGVAMANRRASKAYARFELTGLPAHLSGKYELGSTFANSLEANLRVVLDTQHVCAHLPQVLAYIGQPYVWRTIFFSAGPDDESRPQPTWPGVEQSAWLIYYFVGDNPSKIKPHLSLTILGIKCVGIIELQSLLTRREERK